MITVTIAKGDATIETKTFAMVTGFCAWMEVTGYPEFVTTFSGLYHELGNPRAPEDQQKKMSATIADQPNKHPVMWGILQHHCLHEYFKANPAVSAIDWQSIRDWLKTNWPQIISAICSIIMLFISLGVEREIASDL